MKKEIILTSDKDGILQIETKGFNGKGCVSATDLLETLLTNSTSDVERVYKNEYYNTNDNLVHN